MSPDPEYRDRIEELARSYLAEFDFEEAVDALYDVDNTTPTEIADSTLVKAARLHLETQNDPDGGDPGAALRAVQLDEWRAD